jgi:hypothetical protein
MCRISAGALKERKPVAAADRPAGGVPTPLRHMVAAAGRLKMALWRMPQIGNRKVKTGGYRRGTRLRHWRSARNAAESPDCSGVIGALNWGAAYTWLDR